MGQGFLVVILLTFSHQADMVSFRVLELCSWLCPSKIPNHTPSPHHTHNLTESESTAVGRRSISSLSFFFYFVSRQTHLQWHLPVRNKMDFIFSVDFILPVPDKFYTLSISDFKDETWIWQWINYLLQILCDIQYCLLSYCIDHPLLLSAKTGSWVGYKLLWTVFWFLGSLKPQHINGFPKNYSK